jgi:hypothetical protein
VSGLKWFYGEIIGEDEMYIGMLKSNASIFFSFKQTHVVVSIELYLFSLDFSTLLCEIS